MPWKLESGCPPAKATTVGTACTPNIWATRGAVSTLTLASDHFPLSAAAKADKVSASCRQTSLRGDHSSTTTGNWLDRSSTSSSKLASVISTPAGVASPPAASPPDGAPCLRPDRSTAPAMAGPIGGRGRVTSSSLACRLPVPPTRLRRPWPAREKAAEPVQRRLSRPPYDQNHIVGKFCAHSRCQQPLV